MRGLVDVSADKVAEQFRAQLATLGMLQRLGTTAEEWFRVELLSVFDALHHVNIDATNQRVGHDRSRPDFSLSIEGRSLLIELKVLPQDTNYPYGWQRFQAGANNKKDFENLVSGVRHGVIYVYWPTLNDWKQCRQNIKTNYSVECVREDIIPSCATPATAISYWVAQTKMPNKALQATPKSGAPEL